MYTAISFMTTKSSGFKDTPVDIQNLALAAEEKGYSNFWYSEKYGLYADSPNSTIYDDRAPVDWKALKW